MKGQYNDWHVRDDFLAEVKRGEWRRLEYSKALDLLEMGIEVYEYTNKMTGPAPLLKLCEGFPRWYIQHHVVIDNEEVSLLVPVE